MSGVVGVCLGSGSHLRGMQGKVYVWYWIRTRMPKRVWKRCMEFKMKTEAGKLETYHIDRRTGIAHKVLCVGKYCSRIKKLF